MPQPSRTNEERERVCAEPGCTTKLSVYNLGSVCWQHTQLAFPNYRGKRLAEGKA